jgi:predicted RNA-binding Zn-ribbon protein involved in translation (DUF1610 family)
MGRPKIYTEAQNKRRQRDRIKAIRESTYDKLHPTAKIFDVKCPKCGKVRKHNYDVKYKYCDECRNEVNNTFNTDLYALCM